MVKKLTEKSPATSDSVLIPSSVLALKPLQFGIAAFFEDLPKQNDEAPKRNIYALLGAGRGSLRGFSIESLPDFRLKLKGKIRSIIV